MTPDTPDNARDLDPQHGILPETGDLDTTSIGILGGTVTAQVAVTLAVTDEDHLDDADVVDDRPLPDLPDPEPAGAGGAADHDGSVAADERRDEEPAGGQHPGGPRDAEDDRPDAATNGSTVPEEDIVDVEPEPEHTPVAAPAAPVDVEPAPRREPVGAPAAPTTVSIAPLAVAAPAADPAPLAAKRVGDLEPEREGSELLTADRLLERAPASAADPEGLWQQLVYTVSGRRIRLGDSPRSRGSRALDARIAAPLRGRARFVPVLSRKGGVGKTTVTTLLGMALASARDDRVIAVDANPDRGTLANRIARRSDHSIRDLVRLRDEVTGYGDLSAMVARDATRLDVVASDADPRVAVAFDGEEYRDVAALAAHFYSIVLTDTGTGIVHSVMEATLSLADELVIVSGLSVDEARLAAETLTWLETNGYRDEARRAVVVLNQSRPGTPLVRIDELEAHFASRVRAVVRIPYDRAIAAGDAIAFRDLRPETRVAARRLAAEVVAGLDPVASVA